MRTSLKILVGIVIGWSAGISIATLTNWPNFMEPHNIAALLVFFGPGLWVIGRWSKGFQQRCERLAAEAEAKKRGEPLTP